MKLFNFAKKNKSKKEPVAHTVSFSHLSKKEQEEAIRQGAEKFSKEFTKVFAKLAKE